MYAFSLFSPFAPLLATATAAAAAAVASFRAGEAKGSERAWQAKLGCVHTLHRYAYVYTSYIGGAFVETRTDMDRYIRPRIHTFIRIRASGRPAIQPSVQPSVQPSIEAAFGLAVTQTQRNVVRCCVRLYVCV